MSVAIAALASATTAMAADNSASSSSAGALRLSSDDDVEAGGGTEYYLEAALNLTPTGQLARFVQIGDRFYASATTLRSLGLRWDGSDRANGMIALDSIKGLHAQYDAGQQRMLLQASPEMLDHPRVQLGFSQPDSPRPDPSMQVPGLLLNYDLYALSTNGQAVVSAWNELRLFGIGPGQWSNTASQRFDLHNGQGDGVRLDTTWEMHFPERMLTLDVGDGTTGAVSWSRATRIGGLHFGRDFSLQPYRITTPLATFTGQATLPSTVDLFINGIKQSSQSVAPGQFQLNNSPLLNGAGSAQMVLTDINGQSRVMDFSLYGTPQLLQAGLSDWSLDAGRIRRDYGLTSFSYAPDTMAAASFRHGVDDALTVETHGEAVRGVAMAGIGGVWLPDPRAGVFNLAYARSQSREAGSGDQASFGYQWAMRSFSFSANRTLRGADFRDAATTAGATLPLRADSAFLGIGNRFGQLSAGYVAEEDPGNIRNRYRTLGWSQQTFHGGSLYLQFAQDMEKARGNSLSLSWSLPLDRRTMLVAGVHHGSTGADNASLQADRSPDSDHGGWGWRALASHDGNGTLSGQAEVDQLNAYNQWALGAGRYGSGPASAWNSVEGSVLWAGGGLHAMRRADSAFAVVSTDGVAGVPIKLENRLVGVTDERGQLLVTRLNPWQRNRLSIDPLALPADMHVGIDELDAVPAGSGGVLAHFPMKRVLSLQARIVDAHGQALPAGSLVWLAGANMSDAPLTVIGQDSLLYLQDPPPHAKLDVRVHGSVCRIVLPDAPQASGFADLEGVVCQ